MNYALGFVIIYILGYTLATKQPAMTAATLVKSLEEGMKQKGAVEAKHEAFAKLFSRLFRSQFIAFVGNVVMAFPMALLLIWFIDLSFDYNIAEVKAPKLLKDLSPIHSAAIFHASIAGVFLFVSGLIAGYQSNKFKFTNFYYRVAEHPKLNRMIGRTKSENLAVFIEKKGPGILSNFWFGIFLGSTASIGIFLGLNLDIRHITFAAGNFAMGLYGNGFEVAWGYFMLYTIGIVLIGFANFIVSFSLALFLGMRSRGIPFSELFPIGKSVWYYFKKKPVHFFLPPKDEVVI
jgi:site-specific recombinase